MSFFVTCWTVGGISSSLPVEAYRPKESSACRLRILWTTMNRSNTPSPPGLRCLRNVHRLHLTSDWSAVQSSPTVSNRRVYTYSDGDECPLSLNTDRHKVYCETRVIWSIFLPRDAMLARYMLSSCVCSSVRSSVCHKTALNQNGYTRRITQITPYDSSVSGTKHLVHTQTHRGTTLCQHICSNRPHLRNAIMRPSNLK